MRKELDIYECPVKALEALPWGVARRVAIVESRKVPMTISTLWPSLASSIRSALAAGLAVAAAQLLQLQYPLYALISAVLVTDLSALQTRKLGLWRLVGTLLGAAVGAALAHVLPSGSWAIGLSILAAMVLSYLLQLKGAAKVTGYVCGVVLLSHAGQPWLYALYRSIETALGIGAAVLVSFVPTLVSIDNEMKRG